MLLAWWLVCYDSAFRCHRQYVLGLSGHLSVWLAIHQVTEWLSNHLSVHPLVQKLSLRLFPILQPFRHSETCEIWVSSHYYENTQKEWPEIWRADVSWRSSELVWFWSWASDFFIPPPNEVGGGGVYWIHLVRLSVRPSVCRRHGFRSISQACFGISLSNFICILMVAIGRSLLIFSDVTFKMVAWRPYWIFWFPDSNFTLALNINFKLQRHNTYVYG